MLDESLDAVFSMVEKAFMRLQAGDVLVSCLEKDDTAPMQKLVEGLVLAGPQNLTVLQEILAEASKRKSQMQDDLNQVLNETEMNLEGYGVTLPEGRTPRSMARMMSGIKRSSAQSPPPITLPARAVAIATPSSVKKELR